MKTSVRSIMFTLALVTILLSSVVYAGTIKVFNDGSSTASETSEFGVVGNKSVGIKVFNDGSATASKDISTGLVEVDVMKIKTVTSYQATDTLVVGNLYVSFNTTTNKFGFMYKEASGSVFLGEVTGTEQ